MEPFHELRFNNTQILDLSAELTKLGFVVSAIFMKDSWLGKQYPAFVDLVVEKDGQRAVFAYSSEGLEISETILVYVNFLPDKITPVIRRHLEEKGAKWSFFDE